MMTKRRGIVLIGGLVVLAGLGAVAYSSFWSKQPPLPDWSGEYDLTSRPPERIAPGTVVNTGPPAGWSHLVIKSLPRVREDSREGIMPQAIEKASWMFTAFAADVTREEDHGKVSFKFRAIGLGLGSRSKSGQDVVVTPETAEQFGVVMKPEFGVINVNKEILTRGYATQDKALVVMQGPSFALLDTPVWYRIGERSKFCRYRYALLVDIATGRLDTLTWRLNPDGSLGDDALVVWLHPNTLDIAELVPDRDEFVGSFPKLNSDALFGVAGLPKGRETFPLPVELRTIGIQTRYTPQEAHRLETELRKLIAGR
jgi:hypothetical protein